MIKKILNIKNVGKLKNCSMSKSSEYDFAPNTFFFGLNAKGKSTLTAILMSLSTNDPCYVVGRKTFGATDEQSINIVSSDNSSTNTHSFLSGAWNKSYSDIVVFDTRFVAKNVYLHESVTEDNEKSIQTIILGEEGKKLEKKFTDAELDGQKNSNRKAEITREYTRHLGHYRIGFDSFRKTNPDTDIDNKITQKENEIKAYSQYQNVKNKLEELVKAINSDYLDSLKKRLTPTIELHQEEIKAHILSHLKTKVGAELFLAQGTYLLKDQSESSKVRHCVYCGQAIVNDSKSLIEAYETLFSDSYKELTKSVKDATTYLASWKIEAELRRYSGELSSMGIQVDFSKDIVEINDNIMLFRSELLSKSDLNYSISFDSLQKIISALVELKRQIKLLQSQYSSPYDKNKHQTLLNDKSVLELTKQRGEKLWIDSCNEYEILEQKTKELTTIRDTALQAKNKYAESIFTTYEAEVNSVLIELQADFQLVDTKPKSGIRSTAPLFGICFDGHKIALSAEHDEVQHFGNTLSESDKRLLAFAFFIASLKAQGDIQNKVIVLDDPLSSLDAERKLKTVNLLNKFIAISKPQQLIILTHELSFFALLNEHIPQHKSFKIVYNPRTSTSTIELMLPNEEYLDTYYRQIDDLKTLESAPDTEVTWEKLRSIRDVLEQLFKRKYYLRLKTEITDGGSTSSFVKKLTSDGTYDTDKAQKINALLAHFWNHDDSDSQVKRDSISVGDLRGIIKDFFEVVEII